MGAQFLNVLSYSRYALGVDLNKSSAALQERRNYKNESNVDRDNLKLYLAQESDIKDVSDCVVSGNFEVRSLYS
jgi:hypothetical protein